MTAPTRWWGPVLDEDTRDVRAMLAAFTAGHDTALEDDCAVVSGLISQLAELGIWTIGAAESAGGGGGGAELTVVVLEQLGRSWPALGWAAAQAHTAVDVLSGDDRCAELVAGLHCGSAAVAVVGTQSAHVHLGWDDGRLAGSIDRVDTAAPNPHVLVLDGEDRALVILPDATTATALTRTGLGGAFTRSVEVHAAAESVIELTGVDVAAAQQRLWVGAAAVAAGIAAAATEDALEYAGSRRQFGDTLTAIPTVRASLLAQARRATACLSAVLMPTGAISAYAAVDQACDHAIDVAADALQSHGGYGYLAEYGAELRLRDAVSLRAAVDTWGAATATARVVAGLPHTAAKLGKGVS